MAHHAMLVSACASLVGARRIGILAYEQVTGLWAVELPFDGSIPLPYPHWIEALAAAQPPCAISYQHCQCKRQQLCEQQQAI